MMNSTKSRIAIGDNVALNSGGPKMIVVDFDWGKCVCAYPTKQGIRELTFKAACLSNKS